MIPDESGDCNANGEVFRPLPARPAGEGARKGGISSGQGTALGERAQQRPSPERATQHPAENTMLTWIIYDISKDRTRTKIAKRCLDFGLYRVQKSVFLGDIEPNRVNEIILASTELMNLETDSVYVFPMCQDDFESVRIVGWESLESAGAWQPRPTTGGAWEWTDKPHKMRRTNVGAGEPVSRWKPLVFQQG
jgi:CRISPR-associated protein Cas2